MCCAYPLHVRGRGIVSTCKNPDHWNTPHITAAPPQKASK